MYDKRIHKRTRVKLRVAFRAGGIAYEKGIVENLSRGGVFVRTQRPCEKGDYVIASMDSEELGKILWVQGRVTRLLPEEGMALSFTRTDHMGINALLSYRGVC
ncbi:MAG: PilZ domain-containing protein [Thermodesulfobacteriota bacterium]|nr:PilZ domain-containing protein [Thermodesulfobacteriota bacterium]